MVCKQESDCKTLFCKKNAPICNKQDTSVNKLTDTKTATGEKAASDAKAKKGADAAKKGSKKRKIKRTRRKKKTEWFELILEDTETLATTTTTPTTPPQGVIHIANQTADITKMDPSKAVGGMTHEQAKKLCEEKGVKPSRLEFCAYDVMALGPEKGLELELKDQEVVEHLHEDLKKIREKEAPAKTLAMGLSRRRRRGSRKAFVVYVNTAKYKFKKTPIYVANVHSSEFFEGQAVIFSPSKTGFFMRLIRTKKSRSRVPLRIHWIAATL
jgi:hypothetical protein